MNLEEVFSIFKKNAGVLGKGDEIYPTGAQLWMRSAFWPS